MTPFSAGRAWVRDQRGGDVWLVVVKATFDLLVPNRIQLSACQDPPILAPTFTGDALTSSLRYETDFVHSKRTTDILVHGDAKAIRPTTRLDVTITVDSLTKSLVVFGDRTWRRAFNGLRLSDPEPFTTIPIRWERAYGGTTSDGGSEPRNPIGLGYATTESQLVDKLAPNIEHPDEPISSWRDRPKPVGLGPIPRHWEPRRSRGGTYDDVWSETRAPLLPDNFDDRFHQCAPDDQHPERFLRGGEIVTLRGMSMHGLLRFALPSVVLGIETSFRSSRPVYQRVVLHSLIIEPNLPRFVMVWHSHLPCHTRVHDLVRSVVYMKRSLGSLAVPLGAVSTPGASPS